ncbi:hypothetical protein BU17DRAFT_92222 [Hysterangium stoloniferum]|nr:hypothetical protein BU17DRAFT_92222 [Hysterangium stoloniferum]
MSNSTSEEEDEELLNSDPWKECEQLDSLEYRVIEEFVSDDSTEVMKVYTKVNGIEKLAVLKLYRVPAMYRDTMLDGFLLEFVAYSNLTHFGLCDEGLVPHCYGWYDFASELQDGADVLAKRHPNMSSIWEDEVPPRALLLEYLEDTEQLSLENFTPPIGSAVLGALERIHSVGIIHRDTVTRNILVHPDGKTFWIDFENAYTFPPEVMESEWIIYRTGYEMSLIWNLTHYDMPREQRRMLRRRNKKLIDHNKS